MSNRFTRDAFRHLVRRALAEIPAPFRKRLDNVSVEVRARPSAPLLRQLGMSEGDGLYGYYEGTPLTERGSAEDPIYPDRILIFQDPLEEDFGDDAEEIVRQIRITVLHEVGHHFGLNDADMQHMEEDERESPSIQRDDLQPPPP